MTHDLFWASKTCNCKCTIIIMITCRGVGRGRALGAGAPPFSAKTTLRAPPSLMSLQPGNYWYRLVADKQHVQELAILY